MPLTLHLIGPARLTAGDAGPDLCRNEKAKLVLAYLVRAPNQTAARGHVARMFWPQASEKKAFTSLRQTLRSLRAVEREHGTTFLTIDSRTIRLAAGRMAVDVVEISAALRAGDIAAVEAARAAWRPDLMAGAGISGEEAEEWLTFESSAIREELVAAAVRRLADSLGRQEAAGLAVALARFVLAVEPANETAHLALISLHARDGEAGAAVEQYQRYAAALEREYAVSPSETARQLIEPFLGRMTAGNGGPGIGRPAIAVVREAAGGALRGAVDTSLEEITHRLAAFRHIRLVAPPPGFEAGPQGEVGARRKLTAADRPGAAYSLRLKPSTSGRHVVIELTELDSGRLLLHDRIVAGEITSGSRLDDLFGWRVARIERTVVNEAAERDGAGSTVFARLAQANTLIRTFEPEANERAYALLKETIDEIGPRFAPVHAAIASAGLARRLHRPIGDRAAALQDAQARIDTALAIDPWDPYSHRIAGWAAFQDRGFEQGVAHFDASLELNGGDPYATMAAAEAFAYVGRPDRARAMADRSFRLLRVAPPYFFSYLATIFFSTGDYALCVAFCDRGPGQSAEVKALKTAALGMLGRRRQARTLMDQLRASIPGQSDHGISAWLASINMFRETEARNAYVTGLERAGLEAVRSCFTRPSGPTQPGRR